VGDIIGFFAYPSTPLDLNETIESAIELLNQNSGILIRSWKDSDVSGKLIINQILREIDSCNVFLANIT